MITLAYIYLGFSIFNLIIVIITMATTLDRKLDIRDLWTSFLLFISGFFGTLVLILSAIIVRINRSKGYNA